MIANYVAVNIGADRIIKLYDLASYGIFLKSFMNYVFL